MPFLQWASEARRCHRWPPYTPCLAMLGPPARPPARQARTIRDKHNKSLKMPVRELTVVHSDAAFLADLTGRWVDARGWVGGCGGWSAEAKGWAGAQLGGRASGCAQYVPLPAARWFGRRGGLGRGGEGLAGRR